MKKLINVLLLLVLLTSCSSVLYEKEITIKTMEKSVNPDYKWFYTLSSNNLGYTYLYTNKLYIIGDTIKLQESNRK